MERTIKRLNSFCRLMICLVFFCLPACGAEEDEGENFGNILDSPGGLELTEEEHLFGWGRTDCLICHNLNNIHKENRTGIAIDVEEIQEQTFEEGESICMDCHGANGTGE